MIFFDINYINNNKAMKTILIHKKQIVLISLLVLSFIFSASTALALSSTSIDEQISMKEMEPTITPQFTPIDKTPEVTYPTVSARDSVIIDPMNYLLDTFIDDQFSDTLYAASPDDCVTPDLDGIVITEDTTLCPGEYVYSGVGYEFISIGAGNITLDCDGAILSVSNNPGGRPAISIAGFDNVTVKNCEINNYYHPIIAVNTDFTTISNITFNKGAIWMDDYNDGEVSYLNKPIGSDGNNALASLHMTSSDYSDIHNNTIYSSYGMAFLDGSSFNAIHDNSLGHIPNTANYPVSFYFGRGANNNEFYNNEIIENTDSSTYGIIIYGNNSPTYGPTMDNKIYNNTFSNNFVDIYLGDSATTNEIYSNTISNSAWNGILMWPYQTTTYGWNAPHDNMVYDNNFSNGFRDIVIANQVTNNFFRDNMFTDTQDTAILFWHETTPAAMATGNEFLNNSIVGTGNTGIEIKDNASQDSYFEKNYIENRTNTGSIIGMGNISTIVKRLR